MENNGIELNEDNAKGIGDSVVSRLKNVEGDIKTKVSGYGVGDSIVVKKEFENTGDVFEPEGAADYKKQNEANDKWKNTKLALKLMFWVLGCVIVVLVIYMANHAKSVSGVRTDTPVPPMPTTIKSKVFNVRTVPDDCREDGCYAISVYTAYSFRLSDGTECVLRSKEQEAKTLWENAQIGDQFSCPEYETKVVPRIN